MIKHGKPLRKAAAASLKPIPRRDPGDQSMNDFRPQEAAENHGNSDHEPACGKRRGIKFIIRQR
jgi:hypothetical protein